MAKRKRDEQDDRPAAPAAEKPKGPQTSDAGIPFVPPVGAGFTK